MTSWNDREARKLKTRILRSIDARVARDSSRPATRTDLRRALQFLPDTLKEQGAAFYGLPWHELNANQLFQIRYAICWAQAYGKSVTEYFTGGLHDPIGAATETPDMFA